MSKNQQAELTFQTRIDLPMPITKFVAQINMIETFVEAQFGDSASELVFVNEEPGNPCIIQFTVRLSNPET